MKRLLAIFIAAAIALVGVNLGAPPAEAHEPGVVLYGWGTATLDGVMSPGEWDGARHVDFTVNTPYGGTTPGVVYAMNDSTNLYLAVRFARSVVDPGNSLGFEFDSNHNGILDNGEDCFVYSHGTNFPGVFSDDVRFSDGTADYDVNRSGTNDGAGAFHNDGEFSVYELSHPMDSLDNTNDFSLHPGDTVGFAVFVRMIAENNFPDAFGDTIFPSFYPAGMGDIIILPAQYTVTVRAVVVPPGAPPVPPPGPPPPGSPPLPPLPQLSVPVSWSKTGGSPPNSGQDTTQFNIFRALGTVTLTAPLTTNNGTLDFFVFREWLVGTPPAPPDIRTTARTVTFTPAADKIATARYQQVSSLGSINPTVPDVNPVGTAHTVWVETGVPVAGVKVMFYIDGANSARSGSAYTDPTGKATFTYTGNNDGMDYILASLDSNDNGRYDEGEPRSPNTSAKSWVENFITGGGNIKDGKDVTWTFGGTVGVLPEGGVAGQFEIVNHVTGVSYHPDRFVFLSFSGDETESPTASRNTARFRGIGTGSDGSNVTLVVIIEDADEPNQGKDRIAVVKIIPGPDPSENEPWIGEIPMPYPPAPTLVPISGGNFQVHNLLPAPVVSSGTTTIPGTFIFDFDAGVFPSSWPWPDGDVFWEQFTETTRAMVPWGGATIVNLGVVDFNTIDKIDLMGLSYGLTPINGSDVGNVLVVGNVFAVHTNAGNYAKVKVMAWDYTQNNGLKIMWVTY